MHDFLLDLLVPFFGLVSKVESSTEFIDSYSGNPTSRPKKMNSSKVDQLERLKLESLMFERIVRNLNDD